MGDRDKTLDAVLRGASDKNIAFRDLCSLLERLSFTERIRGSHHIFTRDDVEEILNLQPKRQSKGLSSETSAGRDSQVSVDRRGRMSADTCYEIILYWSNEDQALIAEVPELPGCAADGKNYAQALENVQAVIDEWIETAREMGREIPRPRGRLTYA
jgi:predicted RNase H-like HicB family nuclease